MKPILYVPVFLAACGCTKLNEDSGQSSQSSGRKPLTPPGIAPLDGLSGGSAGAANGARPAAPQPAPAGQRQGIIGKTTNEVVDLHKALAENPNLKVAEQRPQGSDPVSFALDAYVDIRSRASTFGMIRSVQLYQAEHERWPSYDEFTRMMRQHNIQFTMIEPYRKYAYDSQTGQIVVLEDPDEKRRRYEAAGIPVDE